MIINHLALLSLYKISKIEKELSPRAGWKRGWWGAILSALQSTYNNDSALGSRRGLLCLYMNIYVHIHHSNAFPWFAFFLFRFTFVSCHIRFLINKNRKILKFFPTFLKNYCITSFRSGILQNPIPWKGLVMRLIIFWRSIIWICYFLHMGVKIVDALLLKKSK